MNELPYKVICLELGAITETIVVWMVVPIVWVETSLDRAVLPEVLLLNIRDLDVFPISKPRPPDLLRPMFYFGPEKSRDPPKNRALRK